jgi:hypothetical protein
MPAFKIVDQIPEGNTSATKTGYAVHYVGICHHHTIFGHNPDSTVNSSHQNPNSQINTDGPPSAAASLVSIRKRQG